MNVQDYFNRTVVSSDGSKIGSVGNVFVDEGTSSPEWLAVRTGLFGSHESFVPIAGSSISGDQVVVPFSKDEVKDAPNFDTDQALSESDEDALYAHYRMQRGSGTFAGASSENVETSGYQAGGYDATATDGHDTSGPNTDDAMTRSEERLHVGTEKVQAGKARLRKYIVTENVTQTVPVSHEEVRIEREPITDANRDQAMSGGDLTTEEHEVTLMEERVVTSKETVPVERVRLSTETVTEQQQVDETVRKERIETEGVDDSGVYPDGSVDLTAAEPKART